MSEVIEFPKNKIRHLKLVSVNDKPIKSLDDIVNDALADMLISLEKDGVDTDNNRMVQRLTIIRRILLETIEEIEGEPISDYMKKIILTI